MLRNFLLLILTILTIQAKAQSLGKQLDNATRIAGELRESGEIEPAIQQLDSLLLIAKEAGQRGVLLEGIQANGQPFYAGVPLP